jgi:hypothetical protein
MSRLNAIAKLKFSPVLPNAFTEHGAIMVARRF